MPFWTQLRSILPPRIHQNRSKNRSWKASIFWSIFASIFSRFWLHIGAILGPKLGPCWGLKPPWSHPRCLPRRASEPDPAQTLKMAPKWGPQTSKMAPKWGPQTSKMSSLNTRFKSIFPSRGAHHGTQNDHELLKLHSLLCWSTFFTRIWCWAGGVTRSAKNLLVYSMNLIS